MGDADKDLLLPLDSGRWVLQLWRGRIPEEVNEAMGKEGDLRASMAIKTPKKKKNKIKNKIKIKIKGRKKGKQKSTGKQRNQMQRPKFNRERGAEKGNPN